MYPIMGTKAGTKKTARIPRISSGQDRPGIKILLPSSSVLCQFRPTLVRFHSSRTGDAHLR